MVWTALPDGHIDFVNQRWCEYTGRSVDEAHGRGWLAAIHPEDLPELLERWRSILASGEPREMEGRLRRFDGAYRWFLIRPYPLAAATGQIVKWCGINSLTPREREVMALVVRGQLNKQVGGELGISEITVKAHRGKVMRKMKAESRADLVNMAASLHLAAAPRR